MSSRELRIGFVGAGRMGQCAHLRNYAARGDCRVVALAELRAKTARAVARRYGIPRVYAQAEEMMSAEALDAVVASQPFTRHGVLLPGLLKFGKPVFIEKPLAGTVGAGRAVLAALERSGTWIMVGYNKRSDPAAEWAAARLREMRSSGELGRLTYVRATMPAGDWEEGAFAELIDAGDPRPQLSVEERPDDMDAKTYERYKKFVNYYIHQVNLIRFLLGESYSVTYGEPSEILLAGRSVSGVPVVLEMTPYRTTVGWEESYLVAFEGGYLKLEMPAPMARQRSGRVEILSDVGGQVPEVTIPHLQPMGSMQAQAANFLAAVRGEREPTCTAEEAMEDLLVARQYIGFRGSGS